MGRQRIRFWSATLIILAMAAICCLPLPVYAEGGRRVVVSVDTSGSMWAIGTQGQARVRDYLAQVLFGGLDPAALANANDRISAGDTVDWVTKGLCADNACEISYFEFSSGAGTVVPIADAADLTAIYPTNFEGQTNLGTAAEKACTELNAAALDIDELYWVYVSDNVIESVDARSEREKLSKISNENWIQPVFSMSIYDEATHEGQTFTGTVYIEVRKVNSVERVAKMADALAALLDELEASLQNPNADYTQMLEQLADIEEQLAQMSAVLFTLSGNAQVDELQAQVDELEGELARLKELASPPESFALLFPENGSTVTAAQVELHWAASERAVQYEVNIQGPDGKQAVERTDGTAFVVETQAAPGAYAWMVTAIGEEVGGRAPLVTPCEGGIHTFKVAAAEAEQPATLYLVAPAADTALPAGAVDFEWQEAEGLTDYVLQVRLPDGTVQEYQGTAGKASVSLDTGAYQWTVRARASSGAADIEAANGPRALQITAPPAPTPAPFAFVAPRPAAREVAGPIQFSWTSAGEAMTYTVTIKNFESGEALDPISTGDTAVEVELEPGMYTWQAVASNADSIKTEMRGGEIRFAVRSAATGAAEGEGNDADARGGGGAWWLLLVLALGVAILFGVRGGRTRTTQFTLQEVNDDDTPLGDGKDYVITVGPPTNAVRLGAQEGALTGESDYPVFDVGAPDALIRRGWFGGFKLEQRGSKRSIKEGKPVYVSDTSDALRLVRIQPKEATTAQEDENPLDELDHLNVKED